MAFILVDKVSRIYNPGLADEMVALDSVSLSIDKGEITVLMGPSGSGKTSLLSLIGCMARPTAGKIFIEGKDVVKLPEHFLTSIRRKQFGFIFQQFNLIKELTLIENVLLPLYPLNISISKMEQRSIPILKKLNIEHKKNLKIKKLSGGEQQRAAIARSLINEPEIIIADEPTAHLDRKLAQEFLDILVLLKEEGKTVVIATHDPFIHEHPLINKTIVMQDGKVERVIEK